MVLQATLTYRPLPPVPLVRDTFTDVNDVTLPNHTPDRDKLGGGWSQSEAKYTIQNNRLLRAPSGGNTYAHIETGEVNQDIQVTANIGNGGYAGPVFNYADANNFSRILLYANSAIRFLTVIDGSEVNEVINGFTPVDNTDYILRVTSDGAEVVVWLDGNPLFTDTPPALPVGTQCGLATFAGDYGANHGFDDFSAYALGDR